MIAMKRWKLAAMLLFVPAAACCLSSCAIGMMAPMMLSTPAVGAGAATVGSAAVVGGAAAATSAPPPSAAPQQFISAPPPAAAAPAPMPPVAQGTFSPLEPDRLKATPRPQAIALIIGIDRYKSAPPAEFAENDARSFSAYAITALGVPPDRVRLLTGVEAQRLDIERALITWVRPLIVKDQTDVFIFFSGHGLASADGNDLFLLPYDGDGDLLGESSIRRRQLIEAVIEAGARSATLFLDTCYSGGTRNGDTLIAAARPVLIAAKPQDVPSNVTILAAANNNQLSSALIPAKHGLFSYFLMKGLEGEAAGADHAITAGQLEDYLASHIPAEAAKLGRTQMPQLIGNGDRVITSW